MRVAIVGYGSLIWDLENLAPFVTGEWEMGTGPKMPVEFSGVSFKRQLALVLVLDHTLNHQCPTCVIESVRTEMSEAVDDLATRERCAVETIGYFDKLGNAHRSFGDVENWLASSSYDGVVWTGMEANFLAETGTTFDHEKGVEYLQGLSDQSLQEAWRYIEFAPKVTDTPFRKFLSQNEFWQGLSFDEIAS